MTRPTRRVIRCAVYTRKSSEEGLEQAFNSLDAQREAGLAYIQSQRHEGWSAVKTAYDDGGRSGGSLDRPALTRLLEDVNKGRIDVVVVYKVDRLSRSLADFARLMQVFDERNVSFVSVTQQFNTTTSMGRLTLNMLLSFAQFEREVAGERIRDKIAATKRRGVWVCGRPPLGYRLPREGDPGHTPGDRTLRIVGPEAALVRSIYKGFLEIGSLVELARRLNAAQRDRAGHATHKDAHDRCARTLTAPYLRRVLTNPLYIGMITHTPAPGSPAPGSPAPTPGSSAPGTHTSRGAFENDELGERGVATRRRGAARTEVHQGRHEPIIERDLWDQVRARLAASERASRGRWTHTHLLKGKVRTCEGHAMSPASVQRPRSKLADDVRAASNTRLVRYYVSQKALKRGYASCPVKSVNAERLDDLVRGLVLDFLEDRHDAELRRHEPGARDRWVREVVRGVVVAPDRVVVEMDRGRLDACVESVRRDAASANGKAGRSAEPTPSCLYTPDVEDRETGAVLTLRVHIKHCDGKRVLLSPEGRDLLADVTPDGRRVPSEHMVRAVGQAFAWRKALLSSGGTIESLARRSGVVDTRVHALLTLTNLSPAILRAVLTGELAPSVTLADLTRAATHLDWSRQARLLGL